MGLFGILLALAVLMWLAYRGWSILLVAPLAALVAAAIVARAASRPLDADLYGWGRPFLRTVVTDVSARRFVRQAHG